MIYGIGSDLVKVARIAGAQQRNPRFVRRILGELELAEYARRASQDEARALHFLATRFAAKEAFAKALGTGVRKPMSWPLLQTLPSKLGRPEILTSGLLAEHMQALGLRAHVSLADEGEYALAHVIIETV